MFSIRRRPTHARLFVLMLAGALVTQAGLSMPMAAQVAITCSDEEYIWYRYELFAMADTTGAKTMGPALVERGFKKISSPRLGAVVIFQPAFGSAIDQVFGHVAVITKREDLGTQWRLTVIGADNGGSNPVTQYGCDNVTTKTYKAYPKMWGDKYLSYYLAPPNFNSQFTSGAAGWSAVTGKWQVLDGRYRSPGVLDKLASAEHGRAYSTLIFTVRMRNTACPTCAAIVYVRGTPDPLGLGNRWHSGLYLAYKNNGEWGVAISTGGPFDPPMASGTDTTHIVPTWNKVRITAYGDGTSGSLFQFFVNDYPLYSFTTGDTVPLKGRVGFGFIRDDTGGSLLVDWATLATRMPASALLLDEGPRPPVPLGH